MTDRTIDAAVDAILDDPYVIPVGFVHLGLDSGDLYLHTDLGEITTTTPSATWQGTGDLGGIGVIEESLRPANYQVTLVLSGIDSTLLTAALTENYFERECAIYWGFRNITTGVMHADPDEVYRGEMDQMQILDDPNQSIIQLTVISEEATWDQVPGPYYTDAELQRNYSGDDALKYLPKIQNLALEIGRGHRFTPTPPPAWVLPPGSRGPGGIYF